jgi:assimilatory nitrate reductase catalytic subunit
MLAQVGQRMGWGAHFAWPNAAAVFREHAALTAFENSGSRPLDLGRLAEISDADYDDLAPIRWPVARGRAGREVVRGGRICDRGWARAVRADRVASAGARA